jgi:hypothetical protein
MQLMKQKINDMIKDWQFSSEQKQLLRCYYNAKQLLVDCLNSNGEVTAAIKQEMEASIFLPFQEKTYCEATQSLFDYCESADPVPQKIEVIETLPLKAPIQKLSSIFRSKTPAPNSRAQERNKVLVY